MEFNINQGFQQAWTFNNEYMHENSFGVEVYKLGNLNLYVRFICILIYEAI